MGGGGNPDDEKTPSEIGNLGNYALNLIDFFPFCIPRDVYLIMKYLDAEPQAPKFKWNIPTLNTGGKVEDHLVEIDLSLLNEVASIIRIMEKIAFIFGLVVLSRKIVKGG